MLVGCPARREGESSDDARRERLACLEMVMGRILLSGVILGTFFTTEGWRLGDFVSFLTANLANLTNLFGINWYWGNKGNRFARFV